MEGKPSILNELAETTLKVLGALAAAILIIYLLLGGPKTSQVPVATGRNAITIAPGAAATTMERWAAQIVQRDALSDCREIDTVTPSTTDPGGFVVDCINGDRYRIRAGSSVARYERHYNVPQ